MKATDTAGPLEAAEPTKPTRTKSPRYDVYRVKAGPSEHGHSDPMALVPMALVLLATDVAAPTREKAIEKQDDPWGTFATVRVGELKVQTREKEVREEAVWR